MSTILSVLLMTVLAFGVSQPVAAQKNWYVGMTGLSSNDDRLAKTSIPYHVRERYQARDVRADRTNSWIVWASAWSAPKQEGYGRAYVKSLELYALDEEGNQFPISVQTWQRGDDVWGGCYRYSLTDWFGDQVNGQEYFRTGSFMDTVGQKHTGARIDTNEVEEVPAVCHIWQSRWPRDVLPQGTVAVRVKAQFIAFGDALINVGLDRYRTDTQGDRPEQEVLVSDTYDSSHGLVEVIMDTPVIEWY